LKIKGGEMPLIRINYIGDNDFETDRAYCRVKAGETIEWECTGNGFYAIDFGWSWQLGPKTLTTQLGSRISVNIPKGFPPGIYKYTLVIFDTAKGEIFVDDPNFIVRP
jgi:plastocyanin